MAGLEEDRLGKEEQGAGPAKPWGSWFPCVPQRCRSSCRWGWGGGLGTQRAPQTPQGTYGLARWKETREEGHFLWSPVPNTVESETLRGKNLVTAGGAWGGVPVGGLEKPKPLFLSALLRSPDQRSPFGPQSHSPETPRQGHGRVSEPVPGFDTHDLAGCPSSGPGSAFCFSRQSNETV